MSDVLTITDLEAAKKHDTFHSEVITGKSGGLSTGADIDYATNQVTGQVQKTLPKVLRDLGMMVQTWTATTGGTLTDASQVFLNDITASAGKGNYYAWTGTFPRMVAAGTDPAAVAGFVMRSDAGLRSELLSGALRVRDGLFALRDIVSVKDFGVVGDGVVDDTANLQLAFDTISANGGGTLHIPANMKIKCSALLYGRKGVSIKCEPTSWLDFRGSGWITPSNSLALLGYYGTAGSFIYPTADMVEGTNKITVTDITKFKIGDMIELSMDSNGKWEDTSTVVTAGQLAIVTAVYPNTNNIVISEPLYETLTLANSARIRVITPIEDVIIDGLGIIGNGRNPTGNADQGLKIFFGRNVQIKNCRLKDVDTQSIGVISCYGATIADNRIDHPPLGDIDVISYGIAYSSSMHVEIRGNHGINARHGIISSHLARSYGYYGINRFIDIHDNTYTSNYGDLGSSGFPRAHGGIATHTDAEFVNIYDNTIIGCRYGINVRTPNNSVKNNKIHDCQFGVYLSEYWADIEIVGNEMFDCPITFRTDETPYEVARGVIDVSSNKFVRCGGGSFTFPTTVRSTLRFISNRYAMPVNTGSTANLSVYNNVDFTADGNSFVVNDAPAIRSESTNGLHVITNNRIKSAIPYATSSAIYIASAANFVITENTVISPPGGTNGGIACPTKLTAPDSVVSNNTFMEVV